MVIRRVAGAAAAALITAAVGLAAFTGSAGAATPTIQQVFGRSAATPSADLPTTVRHRDATGAITSVWHGPRWRAEQILAGWSATHEPAATGKSGGIVSPDIEQPPHCNLPTTYWVFRADSLTCYRYGGTANINIKNVYEVDSGNNAGYYVVGGTKYYVQKYVYDLWDPKVTVTQIHIN